MQFKNMKSKENYSKKLENLIAKFVSEKKVPTLLLHSCCGPCSSYVFEYLSQYFKITDFYYNPNITSEAEFIKRENEVKRLISEQPHVYEIDFIHGKHDAKEYLEMIKGLEKEPEGGRRCEICFRYRLEEAAKLAKEKGFEYFATTLTISPMKSADLLNSIGNEMSEKYGVKYLETDFKKKGGYQRSIELSKEYDLYRQDYCGCPFSKAEREREKAERKKNEL